ncbi:hypothetical protein [Bradyrhizobium sp. USDA 10063]
MNRFWPPRPTHTVLSVSLPAATPLVGSFAANSLRRVAQIAEIIRGYQDLAPVERNDQAKEITQLRHAEAAAMEACADVLDCEASATCLRLRAEALRGGSSAERAERYIGLDETKLISLSGDLHTWHNKSTEVFHSAFFASVDQRYDRLVADLDGQLDALTRYIRATVNPRLIVRAPPLFKVGNLIFCGGEANRYPKHFAYFLPEDEGIKRAKKKKTVVFSNVYSAIYHGVSEPFGSSALMIEGDDRQMTALSVEDHLICWFRGHDIGHGVVLPETDFRVLGQQGRGASMMLQEVLADLFGLVMVSDGPWTGMANLRGDVAVKVFLNEMLRYVRRGETYFPDAEAAFLELSFLELNGFVHVDFDRRKIMTSVERVLSGVRQLLALLTKTALANDVEGTKSIIERYGIGARAEFSSRFRACFGQSTEVLDYVQTV